MSFNKRYVDGESVVSRYNYDGIEGVLKYYNADALIFTGKYQKECSKIDDYIREGLYDNIIDLVTELEETINEENSL